MEEKTADEIAAIFSAGGDRIIHVWNADTHKRLATLRGHIGGVECLALYGKKLFYGGYGDGTIRVWDVKEY